MPRGEAAIWPFIGASYSATSWLGPPPRVRSRSLGAQFIRVPSGSHWHADLAWNLL